LDNEEIKKTITNMFLLRYCILYCNKFQLFKKQSSGNAKYLKKV